MKIFSTSMAGLRLMPRSLQSCWIMLNMTMSSVMIVFLGRWMHRRGANVTARCRTLYMFGLIWLNRL